MRTSVANFSSSLTLTEGLSLLQEDQGHLLPAPLPGQHLLQHTTVLCMIASTLTDDEHM